MPIEPTYWYRKFLQQHHQEFLGSSPCSLFWSFTGNLCSGFTEWCTGNSDRSFAGNAPGSLTGNSSSLPPGTPLGVPKRVPLGVPSIPAEGFSLGIPAGHVYFMISTTNFSRSLRDDYSWSSTYYFSGSEYCRRRSTKKFSSKFIVNSSRRSLENSWKISIEN